MRRIPLLLLALSAFSSTLLLQAAPGRAQEVPESLQAGGPEDVIRARKNTWTVGMVGGLLSGTPMRFADELAKALDDGEELRVIPMVSYGMASNLEDLLYLRGVDIAITQSDVFEFFRTTRKTPNLQNRINYIIRLPLTEVHILARKEYASLEDLRGKKVSFGPEGAGSSLTGPIIFQRLGIEVEPVHANAPVSLRMLQAGEIAAMIRMVGKPIDFFSGLPADSGLHFLPVPFTRQFHDYYALGEFTHDDYPTLVAEGERVETLAVPTVLAVYNWRKGHDRFRRVERFVERLFANWDKLQKPPFHPKWRDINLAATVPGWTRFRVAEDQLAKMELSAGPGEEGLKQEFETFLGRNGSAVPDAAEREALFEQFLQWRQSRQQTSAAGR